MGKLTCWIMAIILLCWGSRPVYGNNSLPQYSSVRIYAPNAGEIVFLTLYIMVLEVGKKLDKGYECPVYCDVDHKHYFREIYEKEYEQESDIQTIAELHRAVGATGKE